MKILLAEDNTNDVELTLAALAGQFPAEDVAIVRDGVEALDYLHRRGTYEGRADANPVVALLDLKMPKVDGLQVLREMKSDPVLRNVPVVILTTSREPRDLIESYSIGVNGYVVKPVGFDDFMQAIRRIAMYWVFTNERPGGRDGETENNRVNVPI